MSQEKASEAVAVLDTIEVGPDAKIDLADEMQRLLDPSEWEFLQAQMRDLGAPLEVVVEELIDHRMSADQYARFLYLQRTAPDTLQSVAANHGEMVGRRLARAFFGFRGV